MAHHEAAGDRGAAAVADHHRGREVQGTQQRRSVVGLLGLLVAVQPSGRGLRDLPGRSSVTTVHSWASVRDLRPSPAAPVPPVMHSSAGPLPRTSWDSLVVSAWISPDLVVVAVMIVLPFWGGAWARR
jgi:hypothetical protein